MTINAIPSSFGARARSCLAAMACVLSLSAVADAPAPEHAEAVFETRFMEGMIDHHAMAVEMSEDCVAKAVHEELRTLCQRIIAAQQAEIADMQTWLQTWYDISYQPEMTPGSMHRMEKLAALAGTEYEIRFLELMIRHHRMAVVEGARCMERAYHPELVGLCENIVASQAEEIQRMRSWLCEWYGECRPRGRRMRG